MVDAGTYDPDREPAEWHWLILTTTLRDSYEAPQGAFPEPTIVVRLGPAHRTTAPFF
jgi:hypothetical protein